MIASTHQPFLLMDYILDLNRTQLELVRDALDILSPDFDDAEHLRQNLLEEIGELLED